LAHTSQPPPSTPVNGLAVPRTSHSPFVWNRGFLGKATVIFGKWAYIATMK
jgi:hypothetical protein